MPRSVTRVAGRLRVPGDKSISHRSLILAALADGTSRVRGILDSADVRATAACLHAMGWPIPPLQAEMIIAGQGRQVPRVASTRRLPCDNSGTTARLLAGVAAAQSLVCLFDGDASLRRRPMRRVSEPLQRMGAGFTWLGNEGCLPMRIAGGPLSPLVWTPEIPSAQVKGAILLAGLCAGVEVTVNEPLSTRDHTERLLRVAGAEVDAWGTTVVLRPTSHLAPLQVDVPGDPSSAAFFAALAAGASGGSLMLEGVLLNPHRTGFLRVLRRMGARIETVREDVVGGESAGDLLVHASPLRGTEVMPGEVPSLVDEIPVLAVLAALAEGETIVRGAGELRVKESDRISSVVANLQACGVEAAELPDGLVVRGGGVVHDAAIVTQGDHRIAMAFAILGALTKRELAVDDPGCVNVSFPTFWSDLARVTR